MVLMQSPSQLDKYIIDFFENYLDDMVYCLDKELYYILRDKQIPVDIAYLADGDIYLCDGSIYKGDVIVSSLDNLQEQFHRYNLSLITDNGSFRRFLENYKTILEQDEIITEVD